MLVYLRTEDPLVLVLNWSPSGFLRFDHSVFVCSSVWNDIQIIPERLCPLGNQRNICLHSNELGPI